MVTILKLLTAWRTCANEFGFAKSATISGSVDYAEFGTMWIESYLVEFERELDTNTEKRRNRTTGIRRITYV